MADGTPVCPSCGCDTGVTKKIKRTSGTWCASCGALIPDGRDVCPKCGLPAPSAGAARAVRGMKLPKVSDTDKTAEFSAIHPPEPEPEDVVFEAKSALPLGKLVNGDRTRGYDRMAHVRVMIIAAIAALVVVGGSIILITHPFDPDRFDRPDTEQADTSTAGSPGQIESLSGQDVRDSSTSSAASEASEATYELLISTYDDLGGLAARVDEQEQYFLDNYLLEDYDARNAGLEACQALYEEISMSIDALEQIGTTIGYGEDIVNVTQLGRWLLYRLDVLIDSWEIDLGYLAPSMVQYAIDETYYSDKDEEGVSINKKYFDVCYEDWKPQKH